MSRNILSVAFVALSRLSSVSLVGSNLVIRCWGFPPCRPCKRSCRSPTARFRRGLVIAIRRWVLPVVARVRDVVGLLQLVSGVGCSVLHYAVFSCVCAPAAWGELVSALFRRSGLCAHVVWDASASVVALCPPYGVVLRARVEYVLWYLLVFGERKPM